MRFRTEHVADSVVKRIFTVAKAMRTGQQIKPPAPSVNMPAPTPPPDIPEGGTVTGMPAASEAGVSLNDTLEQGPLGAIMEQDQ